MHRWVSAAFVHAWISLSIAFVCVTSAQADDGSSSEVASATSPQPTDSEQLTESDPEIVAVLQQAQSLLAQGRSGEAYELLTQKELDLAGNPSFDYLLGLAALDSRRPKDAAFALARVVVARPRFEGARIELARAQFESGEYTLARSQFQYLLTQSPPEQTRKAIQRYLDAMSERPAFRKSRLSALAQFGAGYDSNANGSTADQTFLGFTLNPQNVATESSFGELTVGMGHSLALGSSTALISNTQLTHRANTDASFMDQTVATLGTTLFRAVGEYRLSGGVDGYAGLLDSDEHERGININAGASRQFGSYEGTLTLRAGSLEYQQSSLRILDANRYLGGVSVSRPLTEHSGKVGFALLAGMDDAKRAGSPYNNDRIGARVFGSLLLRPEATLYGELSSMSTDYDGTFFGTSRKDDLLGITVALDLQNFPAEKWSLAPRLRYLKNDSGIALYEYDRFEAVVFIRRGF